MPALTSADEVDRLVRTHDRAQLTFRISVALLGMAVTIFVVLVAAHDSVLPAPLNSMILLLLVGVALAALSVALASEVRLDLLHQAEGRADEPTQPLRVVGSVPAVAGTVVDTKARAEVVELTDRINRRLTDT